jgi:ubiquinone/menaquinone biosynthesis C-methylase UbiE
MGYYDTKHGIEEYIRRSQDWESPKIVKILRKYIPKHATLLELGMGPGRDFEILQKIYQATGSDKSKKFLDRYKKTHKKSRLVKLDAITIKTNIKFDCIFSNRVLHHLTKTELKRSLVRQKEVLNQEGIAFHTFWKGKITEKKRGLLFVYYQKEHLKKILKQYFDVLELETFSGDEKNDSIYVVLKKIN